MRCARLQSNLLAPGPLQSVTLQVKILLRCRNSRIVPHPLAARVKKPVGMFDSGLFAIKPPCHRRKEENPGFLYCFKASWRRQASDFIFSLGYGILLRRSRPIEASEGIRTGLRNLTAFHCREREPDASRFLSLRCSPPRNQSKASDFDRVQLLHLPTTCGTMGLLFSEIRPGSLQSGSPSSFRL